MFHTEKMTKIRIIGLKAEKQRIISFLHEQGCIDIRKGKVPLQDDAPYGINTALNESLLKVSAGLKKLHKPKNVKSYDKPAKHETPEALISEINSFEGLSKIFDIEQKLALLDEEYKGLLYPEKIGNYFSGMKINFSNLESDRLEFKAFTISQRKLPMLKARLHELKAAYEISTKTLNGDNVLVFIAYDKNASAAVGDAVSRLRREEIDLTAPYVKGTPENIMSVVSAKKKELSSQISELKSEQSKLSDIYPRLLHYKRLLTEELDKARIPSKFKITENLFVVEGWIPSAQYKDFARMLSAFTNGKSEIETIKTDELAPSKLTRPQFLKPFDYIISFFSVPRSDEIDPTWIYIISAPIFYGLIVSDVGYGILSFILATYISTITSKDGLMYNAAKIWQFSSIWVIFFGFLANQYFGLQLNQYFTTFTGLNWLKDPFTIIGLALAFGITQVCIGLLFGFINNWNHGHKKFAVSRLSSIIFLLSGVVAVASALFGMFGSAYVMPSAVIAVLSLLVTIVLSGREAMEITNLISHPLSYIRLFGFGLSGLILAMLINMGFTPSLSNGIPLFIVFLVIFLVLHFFNMLLAIFEGIIQASRLNFIEFFSKFYKGGGVRFAPFGEKINDE
jgi:V/A-type H+-transporting ATPase subunit I